jgi:predicted DNA-binding transcriptional regulator AlpA
VTNEADVIYVPELAKKLGKTEAAVRAAYYRKSDAIPPAFKMGRELAWRLSDVNDWLAKKAEAKPSKGKKQ